MQIRPQTSEHGNVGILISLDTDKRSHEKFLQEGLSSAVYIEGDVKQQ